MVEPSLNFCGAFLLTPCFQFFSILHRGYITSLNIDGVATAFTARAHSYFSWFAVVKMPRTFINGLLDVFPRIAANRDLLPVILDVLGVHSGDSIFLNDCLFDSVLLTRINELLSKFRIAPLPRDDINDESNALSFMFEYSCNTN